MMQRSLVARNLKILEARMQGVTLDDLADRYQLSRVHLAGVVREMITELIRGLKLREVGLPAGVERYALHQLTHLQQHKGYWTEKLEQYRKRQPGLFS